VKIAFALSVLVSLAGPPGGYAGESGSLSISGQMVKSGFTAIATPDGLRTIQRGTSTRVVTLPGDEHRKVVITAWD